MDIAPDTNLLGFITPRRLLTALQEMRGHAVFMLPTVGDEMEVRVMLAAERQFRQRAVATSGNDAASLDQVMGEVRSEVLHWLQEEMHRNDAAWTALDPRRERAEEYGRVMARMPGGLFLDEREGRMNVGDRRIVAEAVVHGVPVLATANMMARRGIGQVNAWLEREGFAQRTQVHEPDLAVEQVLAHDGIDYGTGCLRATLGAVVPARIADLEGDRLEESLEIFFETLRRSGMERTAAAAAEHCASLGPERLLREAQTIHGERPLRSRSSAGRYNDAIRKGAKKAGYKKW